MTPEDMIFWLLVIIIITLTMGIMIGVLKWP